MSLRVLVVDDDPDVVELLTLNLRLDGGFDVHAATDGLSALELAQVLRPDCVLLDVMMPGIDGCQVAAALGAGENTRAAAVILISAQIEVGAQLQALGDCVDDFVVKPFETSDLIRRIHDAVMHRRTTISAPGPRARFDGA